MEGGDGLDAGIDDAADFRFVLGVFGEVAIVGVAHETILQAQGVEGFGQVGGERNDAADGLRDADGSAHFVGDFAERWSGWRSDGSRNWRRSWRLGVR